MVVSSTLTRWTFRESTSLKLATILSENGYTINCFDPVSINNTKKEFHKLKYFQNSFDACDGSHALIIGTEWDEFKKLNFKEIAKVLKQKNIFDLRNILDSNELEKLGYSYYGTGK